MARRGENSRDSRHYYDWLEFAAEDLHCAGVLLSDRQCLLAVGFHCQQAMEKALKALILFHTGRPVDGHNITWLCKTAGRADERVLDWLSYTPALNRLYIEARYPADTELKYSYADMQAVHVVAQELYSYICKQIYDHPDPEDE